MTDVDWELLFRYRGNECTAEERERFERWLAADPKHRAMLDAAVVAAGRTLDGMATPRRPLQIAAARRAPTPRGARWVLATAAAVMVAVGGAVTWRVLGAPRGGATLPEAALRVATTARGERATLRLHDGTRVVLGAGSTLRYPADFAAARRDVFLSGEAYFDVVHDERRPFRVHAGQAIAEDLGTAFSVRAYGDDRAVQVVVAAGKVALGAASGAAHGAVLTPGQLGRLANGSTVAAVERVNVDAYLGWTDGRLVFDDTPLPEALAQLGRWYDADFRLGDSSLASHRITASFEDETLAEVLALLAPATGVRFERRGSTIAVSPVVGER